MKTRDLPSFICLIVVSAVSLFFVPWWAALALFAIGYCVLGYLTSRHAMTGLAYPRAKVFYRAAITGDWSKIRDNELSIQQKPSWGSKLQMQLATVIIAERANRKTNQELERGEPHFKEADLPPTQPHTKEERADLDKMNVCAFEYKGYRVTISTAVDNDGYMFYTSDIEGGRRSEWTTGWAGVASTEEKAIICAKMRIDLEEATK